MNAISLKTLVARYNAAAALVGRDPVRKFESRAVAERRVEAIEAQADLIGSFNSADDALAEMNEADTASAVEETIVADAPVEETIVADEPIAEMPEASSDPAIDPEHIVLTAIVADDAEDAYETDLRIATAKALGGASFDGVLASLRIKGYVSVQDDPAGEDPSIVTITEAGREAIKSAPRAHRSYGKTGRRGGQKNKLSYTELLRLHFATNETATRDEIMQLLGCDNRNAGVAVSILGNSKRTKDPVRVAYDKKTRTFRRVS